MHFNRLPHPHISKPHFHPSLPWFIGFAGFAEALCIMLRGHI